MHPRLAKLLQLVALDNGLAMRQDLEWPPEAAALEDLACALRVDGVDDPGRYCQDYGYLNEFEVLATGEGTDQEVLVLRKGLQELATFLDAAFDGGYYWRFYQ
jgi:hypothetical protein